MNKTIKFPFPTLPIIQGPLAGVSTAPFRELIWRYSKPAYVYTEMISCQTIITQSKACHRYTYKSPNEGPLCYQLSTNNPATLSLATTIVTDLGADLIDLNCGCPVSKIRSKGAGSRLLSDARKIYNAICAMKASTHVPVGIKIRVDGVSGDGFNEILARAINDAGADFVVVHGRHWLEDYNIACRYDEIQYFVNELNMSVIGNGDIANSYTLKKMLATNCHGVMISRASVGKPWLIAQLQKELHGETFKKPSINEVLSMFIDHITGLSQLLLSEKKALLEARSFAKYYFRGFIHDDIILQILLSSDDFSEVIKKIKHQLFTPPSILQLIPT